MINLYLADERVRLKNKSCRDFRTSLNVFARKQQTPIPPNKTAMEFKNELDHKAVSSPLARFPQQPEQKPFVAPDLEIASSGHSRHIPLTHEELRQRFAAIRGRYNANREVTKRYFIFL